MPETQGEWLRLAAETALDFIPGGKAMKALKGGAYKLGIKKLEKQLLREGRKMAKMKRLPVGGRRNPMSSVAKNTPTVIGGTKFTSHALDQMQARGITSPTAVLDVIKNPTQKFLGNQPDTFVFMKDNLKVITNKAGEIVTVIWK